MPAVPASLTAAAVSRSEVRLSFVDKAADEAGFTVQRSLDGQTWTTVANLGAAPGSGGTATYSDSGLARRTGYYYRVAAFNSAGSSVFTNAVWVRTLK